ncbi:MAG: 2-oxoglutarate dehydrogenase E1 component [candidate division Zixibacteria bacterium]|nr:2-oxoglutarate dehydrogenase E1 component [candidate division Zixibacteria bacterium]MBU1470693.1 2-oxoglutarate dehydrogenase E1 component [candidate division Zixibacteria bacterium]MBU2625001.1 2-oxoglutarate dehydrogenase E1 component [candidate division Zixibacteria bacterium]
MDKFSYMSNADVTSLDEMYKLYREDPDSLDPSWQRFFEGYEFARASFGNTASVPEAVRKEFAVINLINSYRSRGHLFTKTNPVRRRRQYSPTLDIENFGLDQSDLGTVFQAGSEIGIGPASLGEIVDHLQATYCESVGAEFRYIRAPKKLQWLQERMESCRNRKEFSPEEKKHLLFHLNQAVVFEQFMHRKFVGQKRFSIEGVETLIPAMDAIIERGAELGIEEFVIGMSHRGRLNVLASVLKKSSAKVFSEFKGQSAGDLFHHGDVKYHRGYSAEKFSHVGKKVKIRLEANPSHLEAIDPVVEGIVRAKADHDYNGDYKKIAPILIHGDAAIAAQGVVYEVIQMSALDAYKTGGTVHVVLNNQVGFTTGYLDGRSSTYCTDVAKVTLSPVFHVNADDVEAVAYAIMLAIEFRQEFQKDVFIDLLGYRRYGHNEGDEPRFTQPLLYKAIEQHPDPRDIYNRKLLEQGVVEPATLKEMELKTVEKLESELQSAKTGKEQIESEATGKFSRIHIPTYADFHQSPETGVDENTLVSIADRIVEIPPAKKFYRKIEKLLAERKKMVHERRKLDWAMGELLAYGTLLREGTPVRIAGQDTRRGTFSHRHAVITLEDSAETYIPLDHASDDQADFRIYNSLLSEYAALGFEFGYSLVMPDGLTIWEAQFGDFANGAQIVIDELISSAEAKWRRFSGLVLYLPHGFEGQGPNHSSARLERFLELSAENNWQIANCTTPANLFHILRRQVIRSFRRPLVILTPKSLLRHPLCQSPIEDFLTGARFEPVIDDPNADADRIRRVLFCSGKIYYDLVAEKIEKKRDDVAIVRIEELYPIPIERVTDLSRKYTNAKDLCWVQEEPANMGAWPFISRKFSRFRLRLIARRESCSPATGYLSLHESEQQDLIERAFDVPS